MADVEISSSAPAVVEIGGTDGEPAVIEITLASPAQVDVLTEGVQGPAGVTIVEWSAAEW